MTDTNILDKSMRSVFVGNIPYEATEEKLKDIFSEVGPVLSFKLVFDRETGKPKGYGFCEYKDQETALSAMRNLNGYEIGGRSLRVDNACTEKSRLEMQSLLAGPPIDNTYGDPVESDKAPEAISKAVASLPPEQMFELMKQMKLCIQNNPAEGRQMLLQNPQLAYALLQAQVVMRIVDPQIAITMLHKVNPPSNSANTSENVRPPPAPAPAPQPTPPVQPSMVQPAMVQPAMVQPSIVPPNIVQTNMVQSNLVQPGMGQPVMQQQQQPPKPMETVPPPRMPAHPPTHPAMPVQPPQHIIPGQDLDLRTMGARPVAPRPPINPAISTDLDMRVPPSAIPPPQPDIASRDPRSGYPRDPRTGGVVNPGMRPAAQIPTQPPPPRPTTFPIGTPAAAPTPAIPTAASDQEKAALIMQVLQLSDDQIAMLPPEQRQSILVLKEQIAKSTQQR